MKESGPSYNKTRKLPIAYKDLPVLKDEKKMRHCLHFFKHTFGLSFVMLFVIVYTS